MVSLPQKDFRGLELSFEEFYDLVIIGMVGLSEPLMKGAKPAHAGGMVNYKRVADNLGLVHEDSWIKRISHLLENNAEAIASHDSAPDGEENDKHWVYLNSGITRIGELLQEKYYLPPASFELNYDEFRDAFLFELSGMAQDHITEDLRSAAGNKPLSYNLFTVAQNLGLFHESGWVERVASDFWRKALWWKSHQKETPRRGTG